MLTILPRCARCGLDLLSHRQPRLENILEIQSRDEKALQEIVRQALKLSDELGLTDTSIALNVALVSLDGKGDASDLALDQDDA